MFEKRQNNTIGTPRIMELPIVIDDKEYGYDEVMKAIKALHNKRIADRLYKQNKRSSKARSKSVSENIIPAETTPVHENAPTVKKKDSSFDERAISPEILE